MNNLSRVLFFFFCLIFTRNAHSATYYSITSGYWNASSTWSLSPGGPASLTTPGALDSVIISESSSLTVIVSSSASCAGIRISNTTPTGPSTVALVLNSGVTLNVSGNIYLTGGNASSRKSNINLNGTAVLDVSGNITLDGNSPANSANLNLGTGASTLKIGGAFNVINSANFISNGGPNTVEYKSNSTQSIQPGIYYNLINSGFGQRNMPSGTVYISGSFVPGNNTFNNGGGTIEFNGTSAQTIPAFNYYNLVIGSSSNITLASSGTIGIESIFNPSASASYSSAGSTLNFNGSGNQSIPAFQYNNLIISNSSGLISFANGVTGISGNFSPSPTSYRINNSTVNFNGSSSQNVPAFNYYNVTFSNSSQIILSPSGIIGVAGALVNTCPSVTNTGSTIEYNGTGNQTIAAFPYNNIIISNTTGNIDLANGGVIGISGNFTPGSNYSSYGFIGSTVNFNGSGAQVIPAMNYDNLSITGGRSVNSNITLGAYIKVRGQLVYSATLTGGSVINSGNTIEFTSVVNQTLPVFPYRNVIINTVSGIILYTPNTASLQIAGNLDIQSGTLSIGNGNMALGQVSPYNLNIGGNLNIQDNAGLNIIGTALFAASFPSVTGAITLSSGSNVGYYAALPQTIVAANYGNLLSGSTGSRTLASTGVIRIAGSFITGSNSYTVTGSTIEYNGAGPQTVSVFNYYNLSCSGTGTKNFASVGNIGIAGAFTPSALSTYSLINSTILFNGTGSQTIPAFSYFNLSSSGASTRILDPSGIIKIAGLLASGTNTYTTSGSIVEFNGTSLQSFTGILGTASMPFETLRLNNYVGLQLNANTYTYKLQLNAGPLKLNRMVMNILDGNAGSVSRITGYVIAEDSTRDITGKAGNASRLSWNIGANPGVHIYPFGRKDGAYIPTSITGTYGNLGTISIGTYPTTTGLNPYPSGVNHVNGGAGDNSYYMVHRFWQVDQSGGSTGSEATIGFTFGIGEEPSDNSAGGNLANIRAQEWNGLNWDPSLPMQSASGYSVTVPGVTRFSSWALSKSVSPLPVELLSFVVRKNNDKAELVWKTASEVNVDYYQVERSVNGIEFEILGRVYSESLYSNLKTFNYTDSHPHPGVSYYRLIKKERNGEETEIARTSFVNSTIRAFQPFVFRDVNGMKLKYVSIGEPVLVRILDLSGSVLYQVYNQSPEGTVTFDLPVFEKCAVLFLWMGDKNGSTEGVKYLNPGL